jgi:hypothetical protein
VSNRTVRRYRSRSATRPPTQTWRTFLANHGPRIWAADLLTVQTATFRTLYVLLSVAHGRRQLIHLNVTASPTAAWVWRQLIQATPSGRAPRFLIRDRDAVYGAAFVPKARRLGVETLLTPARAPRANAVAERLVGTLRRECLDHLIVVNEQHLRAIWTEFACYYNTARPHRALAPETRTHGALRGPGRSASVRSSGVCTTSTSAQRNADGNLPPHASPRTTLGRGGALASRAATQAARAVFVRRSAAGAHVRDDAADIVRRYGSLAAYDEEQRRCGLLQLEVPSRVEHQLAW